MNDTVGNPHPRTPLPWRVAVWGTIAVLLAVPVILGFPWTVSDFIVMGVLLGSVGLGIEFLMRRSVALLERLGCVVAILTGFLTVWVNLAVGMIGDDNAYNLLFLMPLLAALTGGVFVRLHPHGMVNVMLLAAALQTLIGLGGYGMDPRGAIFSACFGLLWLTAAALFRAAKHR
jgi:hypothetical protein